jgi:hypothetical protein
MGSLQDAILYCIRSKLGTFLFSYPENLGESVLETECMFREEYCIVQYNNVQFIESQ